MAPRTRSGPPRSRSRPVSVSVPTAPSPTVSSKSPSSWPRGPGALSERTNNRPTASAGRCRTMRRRSTSSSRFPLQPRGVAMPSNALMGTRPAMPLASTSPSSPPDRSALMSPPGGRRFRRQDHSSTKMRHGRQVHSSAPSGAPLTESPLARPDQIVPPTPCISMPGGKREASCRAGTIATTNARKAAMPAVMSRLRRDIRVRGRAAPGSRPRGRARRWPKRWPFRPPRPAPAAGARASARARRKRPR